MIYSKTFLFYLWKGICVKIIPKPNERKTEVRSRSLKCFIETAKNAL